MTVTLILTLLLFSIQIYPSVQKDDMHPSLPTLKLLKKNPEEDTSKYWRDKAQNTLKNLVVQTPNLNIAKNVILFLGDGMSIPTLAAARVYQGGEETQLSFEKFPHLALSKTYAVDQQVADSANTATAYLCGVKANYGTIGIGPEINRFNCSAMTDSNYFAYSIGYYSQLKNKRTGIVTTATVTNASPSGVYAHTANRNWETDTDILNDGEDPTICLDIATQLILGETGKNLNVIMGGGRNRLLPQGYFDEENGEGLRSDGVNLIETWLSQTENATYCWNKDQLLSAPSVDNLLGLFATEHMDYNVDRDQNLDPSLEEMTEAAIKVLSRGEEGYFLFVEGARIDMAHHENKARISLNETLEFAKAVQKAVDLTDESDTLIVVTADHAHTMSYAGYAERGHDILEFAGFGLDLKVYTTLSYANGPGYINDPDGGRHDVTQDDYNADHYRFPAIAPVEAESHGGDDVAVFARGPWAHLFVGVLEENVIPHIMSFASCVGTGSTICDT